MRRSAAELAKPQIISFFENLGQRTFTSSQLNQIFQSERDTWRLPKTMSTPRFIQFLIAQCKMTMHQLSFPSQPITLFFWGDPHVYEVALSVRANGYLSHFTAMQYHQLIDEQLGNIIYINAEQTPKPATRGNLEQSRIASAFQRPPRITHNQASVADYVFRLLSGKHTGNLAVNEEILPGISIPVRVTSIERTLIDIVVRPAYSGGVYGILEAYKRAAPRIDVESMAKILDQLQYMYPYHQAIGFFMERSQSYSGDQLSVFKKYPKKFNFYADYEMLKTNYSREWRLYYPSYLDSGKKPQ
jgi:predicted transcriptional regulator of viral defense system